MEVIMRKIRGLRKANNAYNIDDLKTESVERKKSSNDQKNIQIKKKQLNVASLDALRSMIWRSDTAGECNYFNEQWLDFVGKTFEDQIGYGWFKGVHPDDAERCMQIFVEHFNRREPFEMEYRLLHNSGVYRWIIDYGTPLYEQNGDFEGFIGTCYDITKRKEDEEKLKEREIKFTQIFDNSVDMIFVKKYMAEGNIQYIEVNNTACKILGYTKEEILKLKPSELYPEIKDKWYIVDQFLREDEITFEINYRTKDQTDIPVEGTSKIFFINEEKYIVNTVRDIRQRKAAEKTLLEAERRFGQLIKIAPYGVVVHDEQSFTYVNAAAAKIFGYENPEDMTDMCIYKFIPESSQENFHQKIVNALETGSMIPTREVLFVRRDGVVINAEVTSTIYKERDNKLMLSIIRDITVRKQNEKLKIIIEEQERQRKETEEYESLRVEFFANLSHEMKTPLNLIFSSTQMIELYSQENIHTHRFTKILRQNAYRMLRLINNLIDITKMDSNYYHLNLCKCDIVQVVENITLSVADYVANRDVKLVFDTEIEEKIIPVDPDAIERIILNLLSNAIKFTNCGDQITVSIYEKKRGIQISIKDTGIGIPKDKLKIIFDRFRQVDKSLTRNHEGSGIGLSLVKSLVEMHHGNIKVKSIQEKGSEFIIYLPDKSQDLYLDAGIQEKPMTIDKVEKINIEFSDIYL